MVGSNELIMKNILKYVVVAAVFVLASCTKNNETLVGEWHCTQTETGSDVYVDFNEDGSFSLYQKIGEGGYYLFCGTWDFDGSLLKGTYDDGTTWGSEYGVTFNGSKEVSLTAVNGSGEIVVYYKEPIPASVIENARWFD